MLRGTLFTMVAWWPRARKRNDREDFVLETVRSLLVASRDSCSAVMLTLASAIARYDPSLDAFLAFVPAGDELACLVTQGPRTEHFAALRIRRDALELLPARAADAGHRALGAEGLLIPTDRFGIAAPMLDRSGLHGVVYVASAQPHDSSSEDAIVRAVEHATLPFTIALERESDRAHATYDGLTGLLTPRAFRTRVAEEIARRRFDPSSVLSLWFIDTDHFKHVNDTFGHGAGDVVLQTMANLLRSHTIAEVDLVGRNGGDEFCALIAGTQKTVAIERAQGLCDAVRASDFSIPAKITASVGVASLPYDAADSSELLEVADAAMYHSKRSGRDRVSFAVNATSFSVYR